MYEGLPQTMKDDIDGLKSIHDWHRFRGTLVKGGQVTKAQIKEALAVFPPQSHPVCRITSELEL
jgi:hypothetical protein